MRVPSSGPLRFALFGCLVLGVLLAGCTSAGGGGEDLPDPETVEAQLGDLRAVEATVVSTYDNETTRTQMVMDLETGASRARALGRPTVTVSNGSTTWIYNRSTDRVQILRVDTDRSINQSLTEPMTTIFQRLADGSDGDRAEVPQLPVVPTPAAGSTPPAAGSLSMYGNVSLAYDGTETVDGREAYVVDIVPEDEGSMGNVTMWIDSEWYYPLRTTTTIELDDETQTITSTYRNVTFNPDLAADTFRFDPPANATVVEQTFTSDSFEARAGLDAATEMDLPQPEVPDSYRFASGERFSNNGTVSATLQYTNGTANLSVIKRERLDDPVGNDDGETVDLGGVEGTVDSFGDTTTVSWRCEEYAYTVLGPQSRGTLVWVARSVGCS